MQAICTSGPVLMACRHVVKLRCFQKRPYHLAASRQNEKRMGFAIAFAFGLATAFVFGIVKTLPANSEALQP